MKMDDHELSHKRIGACLDRYCNKDLKDIITIYRIKLTKDRLNLPKI